MTMGNDGLHIAAAALFRVDLKILIVKPTYRDYWFLPGGHVDPGEGPRDAVIREVEEELGLRVPIGRLLAVDYWAKGQTAQAVGGTATKQYDTLIFLFDGGELKLEHLQAIRLPEGELEDHALLPVEDALKVLAPYYEGRIRHAMAALEGGPVLYLQGGKIPVGEEVTPVMKAVGDDT